MAYALVLKLEVYKRVLREETSCLDTKGYKNKYLIKRCGKHQIRGVVIVYISNICQKLPYNLEHLLLKDKHSDTL